MNRVRCRAVQKSILIVLLFATLVAVASTCAAQGYAWGRGGSASRGGFRYSGPFMSVEIAPWNPRAAWSVPSGPRPGDSAWPTTRYSGIDPYSAYGPASAYRFGVAGGYQPSLYDAYRGAQPTQAELDRERFYDQLDRTHRYQTREERYANDFYNAYASPSAMVNRYRYPYVAGSPIGPQDRGPVPGQSLSRQPSHYQGYVPDDDVAIALRAAANRLTRSLSRKADGHLWMRHLQPDRIIRTIDRGEHPGVLSDLIVNYEGVAETTRLVLIAESEGFQDVRRLLAQYVTLSSPYPSAEAFEPAVPMSDWNGTESLGRETILEDRVIESQIDPTPMSSTEPVLVPPGLAVPSAPAQVVPEALPPVEAAKPALPAEAQEQEPASMLDRLPDEADIELLPAPRPEPADSL